MKQMERQNCKLNVKLSADSYCKYSEFMANVEQWNKKMVQFQAFTDYGLFSGGTSVIPGEHLLVAKCLVRF